MYKIAKDQEWQSLPPPVPTPMGSTTLYVHVFLVLFVVYNLKVQHNLDNQNGMSVFKRYSPACYIRVFCFIYMYIIRKHENQNYE